MDLLDVAHRGVRLGQCVAASPAASSTSHRSRLRNGVGTFSGR